MRENAFEWICSTSGAVEKEGQKIDRDALGE